MPPKIARLAGLGAFGACAGLLLLYARLQERATLRVHRRLEELARVHFAEALVALDVDAALAVAIPVLVLAAAQPLDDFIALLHVERVVLLFSFRHAEERRLRDVHVA